ncbi:hypothetical protein FV139_20375 [Parahaliea maris]|uniref:Uncharacterized protein n=1 Tax=Parahaliea maris TaxID=2716870 RepID=A0A5C8ZNG3_9GAMM|nr:hypothetical protein [Parahaliea maris]TXS89294.1 hypothetical protein FV139_20375 [Parahaliea maris]
MFANSALEALVEVYYAEADLALREAEDEEDGKDRRSWALSVESYTQLLLAARNSVTAGEVVRLFSGVGGEAAMVVAGEHRVMLSHPRGDQQAAYEQQVLNTFCRSADCEDLLPTPLVTDAPAPPPPVPVQIQWSFNQDGMNCQYQGISLVFTRHNEPRRARSLCEQLYSELASLAEELRWKIWRGVSIEWARLDIQRRIGQTGHSVRLNSAGDVLLLRLPVLAANGPLFKATQGWLRNTVADTEDGFQLTLKAADYRLEVAL